MFSSKHPTILVQFRQLIGVSNMTDHVRVNIHAPKERDRLDWSIVDRGSRFAHIVPANQPYTEFIADNFIFTRQDPTPAYKLNAAAHINFSSSGSGACPHYELKLSIPVAQVDPKIKIYDFGSIELDGVTHAVIGVESVDVSMAERHPDRRSTVSYTLDTATGLEPETLITHLRTQFQAAGFATTYTNKE